MGQGVRAQLQSMQRDVISLTDHASYLANKITFLLDAMLGVVNIQQNNIIKIFSIAAVVFMPPTLVASIYGMNFHHGMIELDWAYGYPFALALMVVAAVLPIVFSSGRSGCKPQAAAFMSTPESHAAAAPPPSVALPAAGSAGRYATIRYSNLRWADHDSR